MYASDFATNLLIHMDIGEEMPFSHPESRGNWITLLALVSPVTVHNIRQLYHLEALFLVVLYEWWLSDQDIGLPIVRL